MNRNKAPSCCVVFPTGEIVPNVHQEGGETDNNGEQWGKLRPAVGTAQLGVFDFS